MQFSIFDVHIFIIQFVQPIQTKIHFVKLQRKSDTPMPKQHSNYQNNIHYTVLFFLIFEPQVELKLDNGHTPVFHVKPKNICFYVIKSHPQKI